MSNVNNNGGNGNRRGGRKRGRGGGQPPAQPAQKKQKSKRARGPRAGRANSSVPGTAAFSEPSLHFAPVAIGAKMKKTKPMFEKSADHQRIVHREKIAKIASGGTGVFAVLKTFALNPGVAASFPWLANEAAGYESYRFNRLRYVWIPSIGSAVAGNVIMGPDYDAADAAPAGENALSSYTDADEERIWCPLSVECSPDFLNGNAKRKYVRNGALAANQDVKTYDSGNFFVAVTDDAAAQTGKLWVEYDVSLFNPQVPPGGFFQTGGLKGATSMTAAAPFGTASTATGSPAMSASGLVLTMTGLVIGQEYCLATQLIGTVVTVFTSALTSGLTAVSGSATTMVDAGALSATQFKTFLATAETGVVTYTVTATTVTSCLAVLSVLAPLPGF